MTAAPRAAFDHMNIPNIRTGQGYDLHRLRDGRAMRLCGVTLPDCPFGPDGHSDADVPVHALIDALLGAAALGDIGRHFPDNDPQYEGVDSMLLLRRTMELLKENGFAVGNADVTVVAQRPKLAPHIEEMRRVLAGALSADLSRVSVKAKTNEGLDAVGRGEAIAAFAAVLIYEI